MRPTSAEAAVALGLVLTLTACAPASTRDDVTPEPLPSTAQDSPTTRSTPSASPTPSTATVEPVRVAVYPDEESQDRAFVSEVAALQTWSESALTGAGTLREWAESLAAMGQAFCEAGTSEADSLLSDTIDVAAFHVAAAGTYCPEQLADLGGGLAATGPLERVPVEPRCPTAPDGIEVQVTSFDNSYGAAWTASAANTSPYDALVRVDVRENASGVTDEYAGTADQYVGDWVVATEFSDMYEPFVLAAGESRAAEGQTSSTVYDWQEPSFRVTDDSYLPLGCAVTDP